MLRALIIVCLLFQLKEDITDDLFILKDLTIENAEKIDIHFGWSIRTLKEGNISEIK